MMFSHMKRHQIWNHFVAGWAEDKNTGPAYMTGPKLRKLKLRVWDDVDFWNDVISRHDLSNKTPEEKRLVDRVGYVHARGNFWGMLVQTAQSLGMRM